MARPAAVQNRARAQKKQSLENGVIDDVQQSAAKTENGKRRRIHIDTKQPNSQPNGNDADILNAVISEKPFQIVLRQSKKHTKNT